MIRTQLAALMWTQLLTDALMSEKILARLDSSKIRFLLELSCGDSKQSLWAYLGKLVEEKRERELIPSKLSLRLSVFEPDSVGSASEMVVASALFYFSCLI